MPPTLLPKQAFATARASRKQRQVHSRQVYRSQPASTVGNRDLSTDGTVPPGPSTADQAAASLDPLTGGDDGPSDPQFQDTASAPPSPSKKRRRIEPNDGDYELARRWNMLLPTLVPAFLEFRLKRDRGTLLSSPDACEVCVSRRTVTVQCIYLDSKCHSCDAPTIFSQ